jgi:thiamine biosynthesis lipoprotein
VLKLLTAAGYDRALVAASGDISVSLPPPGKESWTIELPPLTEQGKPRFLKLKNQSVSTSGDLYQFVEIEGVRYSHIVDPRTGKPQTGRRSVTVVADRGWKADALTKAMSLLNPEKSLALAKRYKTETLITVLVGDKPRSHATPGWNLLELREE